MRLVSAVARWRSRRRLRVGTRADLARYALACLGTEQVRGVHLLVAEPTVVSGWVGRPQLAGIRAYAVRSAGAGLRVVVDLDRPTDLGLVLLALLRAVQPVAPLGNGAKVTLAPGLPACAAPLAALAWVKTEPSDPVHLRADDLVIVSADTPQPPAGTLAREVTAQTWFVDPMVHRPIGRTLRLSPPVVAPAVLHGSAAALEVTLPTGRRMLQAPLTSEDVHQLVSVDVLSIAAASVAPPLREQLAACGVVLTPQSPSDGLELLWQSVQDRRRALHVHSPQAWLDRWPSVTAIMLTHRMDHLDRIATQLGRLEYPNLEILIALHGLVLTRQQQQRIMTAAGRCGAQVRVSTLDAGLAFGAAMQQACQLAEGELLTKVDDDDWYAPSHIWDLVIARTYSGAQVVGKALDWIVLDSETVLRPVYPAERYALFVAGGTILISAADLQQVGGWRPVPRSIDRALLEQIRQSGGLVYRTHGLGYLYSRRGSDHTARVSDAHFGKKVAARWPGVIRHPAFGTQGADRDQ
ncbi:MAG: hypothetical protein ACKN9D_03775 [Actinomycetales bacterium]